MRGRKYTFVVEGGYDPDVPARYHPFYITNDPVGGYFHKTDEEKQVMILTHKLIDRPLHTAGTQTLIYLSDLFQ